VLLIVTFFFIFDCIIICVNAHSLIHQHHPNEVPLGCRPRLGHNPSFMWKSIKAIYAFDYSWMLLETQMQRCCRNCRLSYKGVQCPSTCFHCEVIFSNKIIKWFCSQCLKNNLNQHQFDHTEEVCIKIE